MLNKVFLVGTLTTNPEAMPSVVAFTIVVNRKYKDKSGNWQEESFYFDVETAAEKIKQLSKGSKVFIEGSLKQEKEDRNGERRSKIKVIANRVVLLKSTETDDISF
jgi:single-strand DNA-binding protein